MRIHSQKQLFQNHAKCFQRFKHAHTHTHAHIYVHSRAQTRTHTFTHTNTHTHKHSHRHTYTHTHCAGQFATTDADTKARIVQRGAVPPLIAMLSSIDVQIKEMAAFALGRLAQNADNQAGIVQVGGWVLERRGGRGWGLCLCRSGRWTLLLMALLLTICCIFCDV